MIAAAKAKGVELHIRTKPAALAAVLATGLREEDLDLHALNWPLIEEVRAKLAPEQRYIRGIFCGGTLCDEAMFLALEKYDDVYAVGVAAAVDVPWQTPTPVGIPKTGFPTETMAHIAAANIAAQVKGEPPTQTKAFADIKAVCVMDAGNNGVIILADKMLPPRKHGVLIPGPQAHLMKLGFEKYFLWKMRHGYVQLP